MLERYDEGLSRFLFYLWISFGVVLFLFITGNFLPLIFIAAQILTGIFACYLWMRNTAEFNTTEFNTKESTGTKFEWNDIPYDLRVSIIVCVGISVFICGALLGQRYLNLWMLPTWLAPDILISVWIFLGVVLFLCISEKRFWTKRLRLLSQITRTRDQTINTAQQGILP